MKVLLVATVQSHICQFHRPLVEMLHAHGCEVDVAAKNNLAEKNGLKLDFVDNVFNIPFSRSPRSIDNIKAYRQLKKIINAGQYDVIHCNTPVGGVLTRIAAVQARKRGTKVFYTAHGFHFYNGAPFKNWLLFFPIEKVLSLLTDALITIVDEDYQFALTHFHCPVYHIHGVGVDENRFVPLSQDERQKLRIKMGYDPNAKIILCVGELLPNKNQEMAITAMASVLGNSANAKLLIAGNGPEQAHLEQLITNLSMQGNVELLGYRPNIEEYQKIADILVSCSIREGLGLNVIEAMMCGNPVVLTDNRGHRELIDDGRNGFLVPVNNCKKMDECVRFILSNATVYHDFHKNALIFSKKYSKEAVEKELCEIYGF